MPKEYVFFVKALSPLKGNWTQTAGRIVAFLWGEDWNVDSEGNEEGDEKVYQYLQNREKPDETIELERLEKNEKFIIYRIWSGQENLASRTACFLATLLKGEVGNAKEGPFSPPF